MVLGDTGLVVEVEQEAQAPGQELLVGFVRNARNGIWLQARGVGET